MHVVTLRVLGGGPVVLLHLIRFYGSSRCCPAAPAASGVCPNIADVAFVKWSRSLTLRSLGLPNSCINVVQAAVDKYDEVRSPSSLNTLIFCDLYRLLLASEQDLVLEEVGRV